MKDIDANDLLKRCPISIPAAIERHDGKYLLILGDRILARDRTVLRPERNPLNPFPDNEPSGSIGFISFIPEPDYLKGAFSVYMLGVEGDHQRQGHCETMLDWCEKASRKLDLPYVAHINVRNEKLQEKLSRRGYAYDIGTGFFPILYKKVGPVHRARKGFSIEDVPGIGMVKSFLPI